MKMCLSLFFLAAMTYSAFSECTQNYTLTNRLSSPIKGFYIIDKFDNSRSNNMLFGQPLTKPHFRVMELNGSGKVHFQAEISGGVVSEFDVFTTDFCLQSKIWLDRGNDGNPELTVN